MLNEGQSPSNFLARVKKQSKKLFSLSKTPEFKLNNLSEAQDLVAKMSGYPNWFEFYKQITAKIEDEKEEQIPQISFKNKEGSILNFTVENNNSCPFNTLIISPPGYGKTTIVKSILWSNLVKKKIPIKSIVIDVGNSYRELVHGVNQFHEKDVAINVDMSKNTINILNIPLGKIKYQEDIIFNIHSALLSIATSETDFDEKGRYIISGFIYFVLTKSDLIKNSMKSFKTGKYPHLDALLAELSINAEDKSWMDLVYILLSIKREDFAIIAMREASPVLEDFIREAEKTFSSYLENSGLSNDEFSIYPIVRLIASLKHFIKNYPEFNQATYIDYDVETILINFDISNYLSNKSLSDFVIACVLSFSNNDFHKRLWDDYSTVFSSDTEKMPPSNEIREMGWQYYCGKVSKECLLACYSISISHQNILFLGQVIFDEAHQYNNDLMTIHSREARKRNLGILIASQPYNIDENNYFYAFLSIIHTSVLNNSHIDRMDITESIKRDFVEALNKNQDGWLLNYNTNNFREDNSISHVYNVCVDFSKPSR